MRLGLIDNEVFLLLRQLDTLSVIECPYRGMKG